MGIGDLDNFDILNRMVEEASDYGAKASFSLPSMSSSSLGETFTSVATSVSETQSELVNPATGRQRKVRDVLMESHKEASRHITEVKVLDLPARESQAKDLRGSHSRRQTEEEL